MKITHILPGFGFVPTEIGISASAVGGVTVTAWELGIRQSSSNQVTIVGLSRTGQSSTSNQGGVRLISVVPWKRLRTSRIDVSFLAPAALSVMKQKPNLLHCHSNPAALHIPASYKLLHLNNVLSNERNESTSALLKKAKAIICCSHFVRKHTIQIYPEIENMTHVIYNGGGEASPIKSELRHELGIPNNAVVILFVGAINPVKGLDVLAEAFSRISIDAPAAYLLVAGSSHLWHDPTHPGSMSEYESSIRSHLADKPVHFLGNVPRDQIGRVYGAADIFVCPSVWDEPFGIVNVEAMAAGLPVVASAVGGIPEVVNDHVGRLVPPNDAEALGAVLFELLTDDVLRSQLANNALQRSKLFTWDQTHHQIAQIYSRIMADRQKSS